LRLNIIFMAKQFRQKGGEAPNLNFANMEDISKLQNFNNHQIYSKGFTFATQANTTSSFNPQLGGSPRKMHGLMFIIPTANVSDDDTISLILNQETIIDAVNVRAYNPVVNTYKQNQFFPLYRSLSGSDSLQIVYKSLSAHSIYPVFYLSNA
jgi:hypothetical protein